jgi:hypothetical protein
LQRQNVGAFVNDPYPTLSRIDDLVSFETVWSFPVGGMFAGNAYIPMSYDQKNNVLIFPWSQYGIFYTYDSNGDFLGYALDLHHEEAYLIPFLESEGSLMWSFRHIFLRPSGDYIVFFESGVLFEDEPALMSAQLSVFHGEEAIRILSERVKEYHTVLTIRGTYLRFSNWRYLFLQYERMNPGVKIEIDSFDSFSFTLADYAQITTTELMAKRANWDILITSFLPINTYIEKNLFADLDSLAGASYFTDDSIYIKNLIDLCRVDGKLYYLPLTMVGDLIYVHRESPIFADVMAISDVWTWDDFALFLQNPGLGFAPVEMQINYHGSMDVGSDNQFYALISYFVTQMMVNHSTSRSELLTLTNEMLTDLESFIDKPFFNITEKRGTFLVRAFMNDLLFLNPKLNELINYVPVPLPVGTDGTRSIYPDFGYAIMSYSENKDEAADLIRFLADNHDSQYFSSTRRDRVDRYMEYVDSLPDYWFNESTPTPLTELEIFLRGYDKAYEAFNTAFIYDVPFYNSLLDTANAFFNGALNKQTAARELADKLWLRNSQ